MDPRYNPWGTPVFPNTGSAFGVGSPAETAERQPTFVDSLLSHIAGALGRGFMAPGNALNSKEPITTEQMIKPAADIAGSMTLGAGAIPADLNALRMGIKAYHGSPHDFDRFDLSKIGTGEGAQAYGHGLYFAENEGVAKGYRDALSGNPGNFGLKAKADAPPELEGVLKDVWKQTGASSYDDAVKRLGAMRDEAMTKAQASFESGLAPKDAERQYSLLSQVAMQHENRLRYLLDNQQHLAPHTGRMYEVNLNADPAHFLDWDKPLAQQSQQVQGALPKLNADSFVKTYPGEAHPPTGEALYNYLRGNRGTVTTAERMNEAGIPGIKYLDQGSRAGGFPTAIEQVADGKWRVTLKDQQNMTVRHSFGDEAAARAFAKANETQTSNYVMFDDRLIDILRKYGIAGMTAPPIFAGAMGESKQ